jgi:hypothetical protein
LRRTAGSIRRSLLRAKLFSQSSASIQACERLFGGTVSAVIH